MRATWFNQPWVAEKLDTGAPAAADRQAQRPRLRRRRVGARRRPRRGGGRTELPSGFVPSTPPPRSCARSGSATGLEQACAWAPNAIEGLPARAAGATAAWRGSADAIRAAHFPESAEDLEAARERLAFEELFLHQAILATRKRDPPRPPARRRASATPGELVGRWLESLPFEPTGDQRLALDDVDGDLDRGEPMQRLLMGEVGSGKTVVAVYAMLRALEAGHQAVLMAPTETLAEQHALTLDRLLGAEAIPFALLTGATPAASRRRALDQLASGELGLVVGTHALIEPTVRFARLGLCVVDEQHRFGVEQRHALDAKGVEGMAPHVLHMTATPIPRTLSLTAYGDLDTTALHQLPAGRQPVETRLVGEDERAGAYRVPSRAGCARGARPSSSARSSPSPRNSPARRPRSRPSGCGRGSCATSSVGAPARPDALHREGRGDARLRRRRDRRAGRDDGDRGRDRRRQRDGDGDRGGRALRRLPAAPAARPGRPRRARLAAACSFAEEAGELARRRLTAVAAESDGFKLAEVDLELRGEGEILGTRQSGLPRFAVAELPEDGAMLVEAREEVLALLKRHGSLEDPALGPLLDAARRRFGTGAADPIPL